MLNQATMDMLTSMKMTAMAAEFANQLKDPTFNELGFKERLGLLVSAEWKGAVAYGLELMLAVFSIVQGMVSTIITQSGSSGMSSVSLPQELSDAINNVGFWDSIPLWAVTLIGGLLITVLSFTMILTVYGRMFSLWMYAAIAPIPLSTFAGEATSSVGQKLHPQLCRGLFAGCGDCTVLHHFLRHFVQPARRGYRCICGDGGMDLRWGTGVQPAGAGGSN